MAKTKSASTAALVLVIALVAIEHDGVRYEKDEQFELSPEAVTPLVDVNAIKVVGDKPADTDAAGTSTGGAAT